MKRVILTLTVLIAIVFSLLAYAQQTYFVRADVPFEFQVGGKAMPPGRYDFCWNRGFVATVRLADTSATSNIPIQYATIAAVEQPSKDTKPVIVFHRFGGLYFLSEIHQPGNGLVTLTITAREQNLQKLAMKTVEVEAESGK